MPTYVYGCDCGAVKEITVPVSEHSKTIACDCGGEMRQRLTPVHVMPDIQPYRSMATGERIKGRSHHRQHLKDHGLVEVGNERVSRKSELPPVAPDVKDAIEQVRAGKSARMSDNFLDEAVTDRALSEA